MSIVPPPPPKTAPPTRTIPAWLYIQRMSRSDGCPSCITNYEVPRGTWDSPDGFVALYKCHLCEHVWHTSWADR